MLYYVENMITLQKNRHMGQNKEVRHKPLHIWKLTYDRGGKNSVEKGWVFQLC